MSRTRVWRIGALLLGVALVGAACGDDDDESTSATTAAATATTAASGGATTSAAGGAEGAIIPTGVTCSPTSIAFFGALTGSAANLGINIKNGAELAVNEFNKGNPNCKVTLVQLDSQGSPDRAPDLAKQAIDDKAVIGVVGPAFSGESAAAGPAFNEAGLATITASATNPKLAQNGWKTFQRMLGNDATQAPAAAAYMKDTLAVKKTFVIDDASEYGKGLADIVRSDLGSIVVGSDTVQTGQTDFASSVSAVVDSGADSVFYGGYYAEAGLLVKQLREGGFTGKFVVGDGVKDPGFVDSAGAGPAEGAIITCPCAPPESAAAAFVAAYTAAYGPPQTYSAEAYDSASVFLRGLAEGVKDRAGMVTFVRGFDGPGVTKHISFDDKGEVKSTDVWAYNVKGGQIVGISADPIKV